MKTDLITTRAGVDELSHQWNALAQLDTRDGFFRTAHWYQAWMQHIRPDAEPFVVVVTNSLGRIVGLAPLCKFVFRDRGVQVRAVGWGGRDVVSADFLDIVCECEYRSEVIRSVIDLLWTMRSEWSLLLCGELLRGSDTATQFERFIEKQNMPIRRQESRSCPYIALPASFDEYLAGLSGSTRYHIRRRMRDILEKSRAELFVYSNPQSIIENLDALVSLHLSRWRKAGSSGTLGSPGFRDFLSCICRNPPPGSSCRLYLLRHESLPVCALLMFYFGESALYYQAGWDPDSTLASHSPAAAVMAQSISDSIKDGFKYYEFLRGDEAYKLHWTKTYRETYTLLGARSFWTEQYLRACELKDLVKRRMANVEAMSTGDARPKVNNSETPLAVANERKGI